MTITRPYQITAEFLSTLRTEGFVLGISKHLQIQTLLQKLPADTSDDALKLGLIPLLAQSPSEQERLYGIFEDCVKRVSDTELTEEEKQELQKGEEKAASQSKLRRIIIPSVLALILVIGGGYFLYKKLNPPVEIPQPNVEINAKPNEISKSQISKPESQNPKLETPTSYFVDNKPYPFPNHLQDYDIEVSPTQQWLSDNWAWLRWVLAVAFTSLLLALWRYLVWKRRKLVAEQDPNDKPPYFWNVHIESVNDFLEHDSFDRVSQLLRKRADTDTLRLDMPRTIQATVEKGGMPEFRFKKQTTPSEYLLLIDRQSVRNHRAQLFNKLYEAFKAQEIEISRYFYDSDMRMCFDEAHPYGISIADVQQRHYQSRLIVVGTGAQMLAPLSGKLAAWTSIFSQWKDRALLTPKPLKAWGYDERQLASVFTTLPSTLQGLGFWVEELDMGNDARFETWREKIHDAPNAPIQPDELDPIPLLSLYYDIPMLKWICACAIYPTLHWDLTLWLYSEVNSEKLKAKSEVSTIHSSLFTDLTELTRLSWFVSGEMPNETRVALINWLEEHDPELLQHLRLAIALELQKNPPPKDSVALEPFRMSVAVNEWLATDNAACKKELEEEIKQLLEKGIDPDFTVIKYLTKPRTKLEFYIPNSWRKYVYPKGFSALGWLKEVKDLRWLVPLWVLGLVALLYPYNFKTNNCSTDRVVSLTVRDTTRYFCLDEPLSALAYQEQLIRTNLVEDYVKKGQLLVELNEEGAGKGKSGLLGEGANFKKLKYEFEKPTYTDSLFAPNTVLNLIDLNHPLSLNRLLSQVQYLDTIIQRFLTERSRNFAIDFYYLSKRFYDNNQKDLACQYLAIATKFDSLDNDIKVAQALLCGKTNQNIQNQYQIAPKIEGKVITESPVVLGDGSKTDVTFDNSLADVKITGVGVNTRTNAQGIYTLMLPPQYPSPTINLIFIKNGYMAVTKTLSIEKVKQLPVVVLAPIKKPNEPAKTPLDTLETTIETERKIDTSNNISTLPVKPSVIPTPSTTRMPIETKSVTDIDINTNVVAPATIFVKGGAFIMGKETGLPTQKPEHLVNVNNFYISPYEVTFDEYDKYRTKVNSSAVPYPNDEGFGRGKRPVINVSWFEAIKYCNWLSVQNKLEPAYKLTGGTGVERILKANGYRLPTEAEWEYAASLDSTNSDLKYSGSENYNDVAVTRENSKLKTEIVGSKGKKNGIGAYDMSGNVWEWVEDCWVENYNFAPRDGTARLSGSCNERVVRGGSWLYINKFATTRYRTKREWSQRFKDCGFRLARSK